MKQMTEQEWGKAGELAKRINSDLNELTVLTSKGMGKKHTDSLRRASKHLNKYRSEAENLMFTKGIERTDIFY